MSSGRGPGVIGMLMALVVLGGFGSIYVFVFDKEMQGKGVTIESQIRDNADEIESLNVQIAHYRESIADGKKDADMGRKAEALTANVAAGAAKLTELQDVIAKTDAEISQIEKAHVDYRNQYRSLIRSKAVGETFPEVQTNSGKTYKQVEIREVTDIGINIRHLDGMGRIAYEEFNAEWQERFQYDPKEKAAALAKEEAARRAYEAAMAEEEPVAEASGEGGERAAPEEEPQDPKTQEGADQIRRLVQQKEIQLAKLRTELGILQKVGVEAEADEHTARSRGNSGMSKVMDVRKRIQAKERQIRAVVFELANLKTKQRF